MNTKFVWLSAGAVLLLTLGAVAQDEQIRPNNYRELGVSEINRSYGIIGLLKKRLGTYLTIEGDYFGPNAKTKSGFYVDAIDGEKLTEPIRLTVNEGNSLVKLERQNRYKVRAYETGGMIGMVDDPQNPPTPEQLKNRQAEGPARLFFETQLIVTKIEASRVILPARPAGMP